MKSTTMMIICLGLLVSFPASSGTIRVPADQPTIQAGVDAAQDGDTVLVADGTYSGLIRIHGKAIRLLSEGGSDACIISTPWWGMTIFDEATTGTVVDGFTIRSASSEVGAGIYISLSSPTILNCEIENCHADTVGGAIFLENSNARLQNLNIHDCSASAGGGLYCNYNSNPEIIGCSIQGNVANAGGGGGIACLVRYSPVIRNCLIHGNRAVGGDGGGILLVKPDYSSTAEITGNVISENHCGGAGGGIYCADVDTLVFDNNVLIGNSATTGGGLYMERGSDTRIIGCTVAGNEAGDGGGISCDVGDDLTIARCIIWDNEANPGTHGIHVAGGEDPEITWSDVQDGWPGTGNINADPIFVEGPRGGYYLSQTAAGQAEDSPCLDAGDPAAGRVGRTTRTDGRVDRGVADLGWHYPTTALVAGPGAAKDGLHPPLVRGFSAEQDALYAIEFAAYGCDHHGVNLACGDVDGDGFDEIITGAGPGEVYGPHVRVFTHLGTVVEGLGFLAYGTHRYGVNVAAGDLDGNGTDEIVTGAGPGALYGPHVRGFAVGEGSSSPLSGVSYFAYRTLKWGVNVACGDIDGDGMDEIVTGAGPSHFFGTHVRGWNVDGDVAEAISAVSYFAYGSRGYGVKVACGDIDGDGIDEIITAPGPEPLSGAHIRGWNVDGASVTPLNDCNFFAFPLNEAQFGANLDAGADLDADGRDDLLVGGGPDPQFDCQVAAFSYADGGVRQLFTFLAFSTSWRYGTSVASGSF